MPFVFKILDHLSAQEFAKIDIAPKNLAFAVKKGCENQGQCKNLEFVQIVLIL